jgi:hypothetical protein
MMDRAYVPRPRWAVVAFMVSLHEQARDVYSREMWLVELWGCATHGRREAHA